MRTLVGKRIAVIGPGTEETLAEGGLIFDLMPEIHDASHLGAALAERMGPGDGPCFCVRSWGALR